MALPRPRRGFRKAGVIGWVAHNAPDTNGITALCLDPHDLWLSKAYAGRDKDIPFCNAMFAEGLVDPANLRKLLPLMGELPNAVGARIEAMIGAMEAERARRVGGPSPK